MCEDTVLLLFLILCKDTVFVKTYVEYGDSLSEMTLSVWLCAEIYMRLCVCLSFVHHVIPLHFDSSI